MKYLLFIFLLGCAKERSCEGCRTITVPATRLVTSCSIFIADNSQARAIYPQVRHKLRPGVFEYIESIKMDTSVSSTYHLRYDLADYYDTSKYNRGDTFFFRAEVRWRGRSAEYFGNDTLIK